MIKIKVSVMLLLGVVGFPFLVNSIRKFIWQEVTKYQILGEVVQGIAAQGA
jgi:hypothetical protein